MGNRQETGESLRQARELKGLSLEDAQAKTKIHIGVLRSLEKGEVPRNVNPIYLKGFLKIYAGVLGLDTKSIVEGFNLDLPVEDRQIKVKEESKKKEINFSLQEPYFKTAIKSIVSLVVLIVAIVVVFSLLRMLFHKKPKPPVVVKHVVTAITEPEAVTAPPAKVSNIPIEKSSRIKLAIRAKESAWIQVKTDGKTVFSGILRRGLSETWTAKEKIDISLGDAGGVELEVNGKRIPSLGRKGEVVRNIKIGKDSISVGQSH